MKLRIGCFLLFLACMPAVAAPSAITPRADHHQHLLSPAVALLINKTAVAVNLPADLAKLLDARAAHWNDKSGLAALLTDDSFAVTNLDVDSVHGRDKVAAFLATRFRGAYRMIPIAFNASAASSRIAGYFARGEGDATRPFGFFNLSLVKSGAEWRIASEMLSFPGPARQEPQGAKELVAALDDAGIAKAVVLSDGYFFDSPHLTPNGGSYDKVRAENDWTAAEVAPYPDRLVAFCSLNPLSSYALRELRRCAASGHFKGLKLHFGVSGVNLDDPAHVAKVRAVVAEANRLHLHVIAHVRTDAFLDQKMYGARQAQVLLDRIVSAAPDVSFTIAHLWGGEGYQADALAVYARAVREHDPHAKNLYFDLAQATLVAGDNPDALKEIAQRIREIGIDRVLYATDGPLSDSGTPRDGWALTRAKLPLTEAEFEALARNVAPYLR